MELLSQDRPHNLYLSGVRWDRNSILALLPLIDCGPYQDCRRCCQLPNGALVQDYEVERIARFTGRNPERLRRKWRAVKGGFLMPMPCEFWTPQGCSIWAARPVVCKYFPLQRVPYGDEFVVGVFVEWCRAGHRCIERLQAWEAVG